MSLVFLLLLGLGFGFCYMGLFMVLGSGLLWWVGCLVGWYADWCVDLLLMVVRVGYCFGVFIFLLLRGVRGLFVVFGLFCFV